MDKEIRIRITPEGKVEIDSTVFEHCKEVADLLTRHLGEVESFIEKDEFSSEVKVKVEAGD